MHEHYYTDKPKSKTKYGVIETTLRGKSFKFLTASGVFSYKKIDRGTAILAEKMIIDDDARVLDLGCGYGVLGIVAARAGRNVKPVLTEINSRAAMLAEENLTMNNIVAEVRKGSFYDPVARERFDTILCNLPMSAGLETAYKIIKGAYEHLNNEGSLQVVVRRGSKRIEKKMLDVYDNVVILARKGGYRVFISYRK
ncbi:MAG: methyltransferase [Candidatus Hydrothermarchaeota archaeon]|jgi:16S rRNA G1207 methylase RsmC|nr:methyltransferase [Candidatus Hydrothermarchaeota archaeon]